MKGAFSVWVDAGGWVVVVVGSCVFGFAEMAGNLIQPFQKARPSATVIAAMNK